MMIIFGLVALFASILGLLIYRYNGEIQVFRLDFVQFLYLTVFAPMMFVWSKTFLFFVMRTELQYNLSINELFIIDTVFSVLAFFIFSSIAIHSLTKTFWIKRRTSPRFDLFKLSEYFHLWWSHVVMFGGSMLLFTFISMANIYAPFVGSFSKMQLYAGLSSGIVMGILFFYMIWNSDPLQGNFMRTMKVVAGVFFLVHVAAYFLFEPKFSLNYGAFWLGISTFFSLTACSAIFERSERALSLRDWFLHPGWGENIDIFKQLKKK